MNNMNPSQSKKNLKKRITNNQYVIPIHTSKQSQNYMEQNKEMDNNECRK